MVHNDLWDIWGLSAFTHLENVGIKKPFWKMTQGPNVNGFREDGGRVIACQRECEAEMHEWENERDEILRNEGEVKRKKGKSRREKGVDDIFHSQGVEAVKNNEGKRRQGKNKRVRSR